MTKIYDFILKVLRPFVVWWGGLYMPFSRKRVTGRHYYLLRDNIKVGDVLLTTTRGEFSNLINPEKIKHGGIYVGEIDGDGIKYVIEAVGRGVVKTDLVTFLTTKDLVVNCRPQFLTNVDQVQLTKNAKTVVGIPYDYSFKEGPEAMYCFETVAYLFRSVRPEIQLKMKSVVKGKDIFSYETYLNDSSKFTTVFRSNEV
jgi:hypothetical protein